MFADDCAEPGEPPALTARDRILAALDALNEDELEVITTIAERLAMGRQSYGPLDVMSDPRDWVHEGLLESADLAVYLTVAIIRERRQSTETAQQTIARVAREQLGRLVGKEREG